MVIRSYLKTVLDQGYWPESNLTPPSDEAIQDDIRIVKELGFNGVRKHQKVEDPRFLYWADRMGLLVAAEMANAYLFNEDAIARMTREWIEVVSRDYNHPSIIIWTPVNESWGVPNLTDPRQQAHLKALYYLTKSLDNTGLCIDNDGWEHTEVTDLFAIHDYTPTGQELLLALPEHRAGAAASPVRKTIFGARAAIQWLPDPALGIWRGRLHPAGGMAEVPENSWGYSGVEADRKAALARMRGLYEAIARISANCRDLLHPTLRRGAGGERPDDV